MLKQKKNTVNSNCMNNNIGNSVKVKAGSLVIDNKWVSYDSYMFNVTDYINRSLSTNRSTFFSKKKSAIYILVTLGLKRGISILEGKEVRYISRESVPRPTVIDSIPLVGIILRQDGTDDLSTGFILVTDKDLDSFSGTGNIIEKNLVGITGLNNNTQGLTGIQGNLGDTGLQGLTGLVGDQGETGVVSAFIVGETGAQGATGISWDTHVPFSLGN